jgi:CRISPR-associated endonuclease/helicase Cas3
MSFGTFNEFVAAAFKQRASPFEYQRRLTEDPECRSRLISVPTGCGKTAAAVLAWLWNRVENKRSNWPRRLVYCLPMRTLVEQTRDNVCNWLQNIGDLQWDSENDHAGKIGVHILMGGEEREDNPWDLYPEHNAILIGTQDMLLSRALNRGYGMSRYRWPMHFGSLNNDALWVMDETQLMGVGVETSAQLDAFRHAEKTRARAGSRTWWMSATLDEAQLATVDHPLPKGGWPTIKLEREDLALPAVRDRFNAKKKIARAPFTLDASTKDDPKPLAKFISKQRAPDALTLVIVNRVQRAQEIYKRLLEDGLPAERTALIHSRFRPPNRKAQEKILHAAGERVVIATQAVEAGVDISARVLATEVAPWPSLVQRFGRCNRYGEYPKGTEIFWIDLKTRGDKDELALPYSARELDAARKLLVKLGHDASPRSLKEKIKYEAPREIRPVIRRKDLVDLFDTTPDLCGNDLDISRYVRDGDDTDAQVYWREVQDDTPSNNEPCPRREEICRVSIVALKNFLQKKKPQPRVFLWNPLDEKWEPVKRARPGQVYLIDRESGGYSDELGWTGDAKDKPSIITLREREKPDAISRDPDAFLGKPGKFVLLEEHTGDVVDQMDKLVAALSLNDAMARALRTAALWHDVGKAHAIFQEMLTRGEDVPPEKKKVLLAKSDRYRGGSRRDGVECKGFRHELASALAWLQNAPADVPDRDLVAFLIAAHHGKVRVSIRSLPNETPPPEADRLYARGVWDGDLLPGAPFENLSVNGQVIPQFPLDLSFMRLGDGPRGPSWLARMVMLRDTLSPFRLAYLETLLRVADARASAAEAQPQQT